MRYAAYGSNLHPLRLSARISSAKLITTRFLPDWSLHFNKRSVDMSGKCNIVCGGNGIHIAIYDISTDDRIILNEIEGVGSGYAEISLLVPEIGECMSYTADHSFIDNKLVAYDWYKELVLIGARAHEFPVNYIDRIEAVATCEDPDQLRSTDAWQTVEMLYCPGWCNMGSNSK